MKSNMANCLTIVKKKALKSYFHIEIMNINIHIIKKYNKNLVIIQIFIDKIDPLMSKYNQ